MVNDLLEPLKVYNSHLKQKVHDTTVAYFDKLVETSAIDIQANKKTMDNYRKKISELAQSRKKLRGKRAIKVLMIVFMSILSAIAILLFFLNLDPTIPILVAICAVAIDVLFIILLVTNINNQIKQLKANNQKLEDEITSLRNEGYDQLAALNVLYDWNIPSTIINSTNDIIKMDKLFDVNKLLYLKEKFGYVDKNEENVSAYYVQSGSILGNPFLICNDYIQEMTTHTYTGSITIHWTERVKTKDGWTTVHKSQVLTASVTKPKPIYFHQTYLLYGNEAADKLTFSRSPSSLSKLEDNKLDKSVAKEAKKLDKKAQRELMDDDPTTNYTRFGNDEFEVLFGGTNRNDELQYRLLFTPLAQNNMLDILKTEEPYGDDFTFVKDKKMNMIVSKHSQSFNYKASPEYFIDFDFENAKKKFIDYNTLYFQSFYFDLAPLLAIPLYQHTKTREYIYEEEFESNLTRQEHEIFANSFNQALLKDPSSATDAILKTRLVGKQGNCDIVDIDAHSFYTVSHTTFIDKMGGDGRMHSIPVTWLEYIPVNKVTRMVIKEKGSSRTEYISASSNTTFASKMASISAYAHNYERGLFGALTSVGVDANRLNVLNDILPESNDQNDPEVIKKKIKDALDKISKAGINLNK